MRRTLFAVTAALLAAFVWQTWNAAVATESGPSACRSAKPRVDRLNQDPYFRRADELFDADALAGGSVR